MPKLVVLAQLDEAHGLGVVEQGLEEVGEPLVERGGALHFVEHLELRWQLRLDRELVEQSAGERVQRADGRQIEIGERGRAPVGRWHRRRSAAACSERADAVAQLGRGLLGERDGGDASRPAHR